MVLITMWEREREFHFEFIKKGDLTVRISCLRTKLKKKKR
jgi:hypothetical protein